MFPFETDLELVTFAPLSFNAKCLPVHLAHKLVTRFWGEPPVVLTRLDPK